jgi:hypothetical protein
LEWASAGKLCQQVVRLSTAAARSWYPDSTACFFESCYMLCPPHLLVLAPLQACVCVNLSVCASHLLLCLPPGDYGGDGYEDDGPHYAAGGDELLGGASLLEVAAEAAEAGGLRPWAALAGAGRADGLPEWMGGADDSSGEQSYEELCRCAGQGHMGLHTWLQNTQVSCVP